MKCRTCGRPRRRGQRSRLLGTVASVMASVVPGMGPLGAALLSPLDRAPEPEVEVSMCRGCGVLFGGTREEEQTCPVCLKTMGWKKAGILRPSGE